MSLELRLCAERSRRLRRLPYRSALGRYIDGLPSSIFISSFRIGLIYVCASFLVGRGPVGGVASEIGKPKDAKAMDTKRPSEFAASSSRRWKKSTF